MRILYVINIIQAGGAEIQMINLAQKIVDNKEVEIKIISLKEKGNMPDSILSQFKVEIIYLGLNHRNLFSKCRYLVSYIKRFKPDAIHTWMYHSNVFLTLALGFSRQRKKVIWSIHHNDLSPKNNKLSTLAVSKLSALISHIFKPVIVFVSESAKKIHIQAGYYAKKALVIENAIDQKYFTYRKDSRNLLLKELHLPDNAFIIGYFGRFDIIKNHKGFLQGLRMFLDKFPNSNVFVIMAGKDISNNNPELLEMINNETLGPHVKLLGIRTEMPFLYSALDLCVLMSFNESFSLVLVEAISCGVVCIASKESDPLGVLDVENILSENSPSGLCTKLTEFIIKRRMSYKTKMAKNPSFSARFDLIDQSKKYKTLYQSLS